MAKVVLLFELLTGKRPGADADPTREPERPSTVVTAAEATSTETAAARQTTTERLARRLRGDLDVICPKALQPERRYASAEAFVEDIRRHLAGLPVVAQWDSVSYRLRKFVHRHRRGVLASVAGALLLALVVGFYTVRLQAERDRTVREAQKAERLSLSLTDLFGRSDPHEEVQGDTLRARDLLARGTARIESELSGEPKVQAVMFNSIGTVYARQGRPRPPPAKRRRGGDRREPRRTRPRRGSPAEPNRLYPTSYHSAGCRRNGHRQRRFDEADRHGSHRWHHSVGR